jgi:hypothetical protein
MIALSQIFDSPIAVVVKQDANDARKCQDFLFDPDMAQ